MTRIRPIRGKDKRNPFVEVRRERFLSNQFENERARQIYGLDDASTLTESTDKRDNRQLHGQNCLLIPFETIAKLLTLSPSIVKLYLFYSSRSAYYDANPIVIQNKKASEVLGKSIRSIQLYKSELCKKGLIKILNDNSIDIMG